VIFLTLLRKGLSLLIFGSIIPKTAELGSKNAGVTLHVWENCIILKKITIGKRPFKVLCHIKS
jgi:hypothetical protein